MAKNFCCNLRRSHVASGRRGLELLWGRKKCVVRSRSRCSWRSCRHCWCWPRPRARRPPIRRCSSSRRRQASGTTRSRPGSRPSSRSAPPTASPSTRPRTPRSSTRPSSPSTRRSCSSRPPATCSTPAQQTAFEDYIQAGGGYAGVHAAADTEYDWGWYGDLVGAYFNSHPANQTATVDVEDAEHPSTACVPAEWARFDEWYNYRANPRPDVNVLATLDESSYSPGGGAMGADHPIAWYHEFDGGRSWYTGMGHTQASSPSPRTAPTCSAGSSTPPDSSPRAASRRSPRSPAARRPRPTSSTARRSTRASGTCSTATRRRCASPTARCASRPRTATSGRPARRSATSSPRPPRPVTSRSRPR